MAGVPIVVDSSFKPMINGRIFTGHLLYMSGAAATILKMGEIRTTQSGSLMGVASDPVRSVAVKVLS
jgi:hypothetical protein